LAAHSLKSQSILMGYNGIGNMALLLEKIFKETADNPHPFSSTEMQNIRLAADVLVSAINEVEIHDQEPDMRDTSALLETISNKYRQ